jgi:hypothetical protein
MQAKYIESKNKKPDFKTTYAPSGWIYVVIGDCVWGRGKTIQAAYEAAKKPKYYVVVQGVDGTRVDSTGHVYLRMDNAMEKCLYETALKTEKYWYKVVYENLPLKD